jgi:aspartate aminotransferase
MEISAKAAALRRAGVDVISLSAGEPDFDTPQHIKDAAIRAIQEGFTKYTIPGSGIIELKEAVCAKFREDNGLEYNVDQVIVNNGAKHSLYLAMAALLDPGDEVIIPTPYWVTYSEQPRLMGAEPVIVETCPENGLKLTAAEFRAAITPRTKMLVLNSPSNPSGAVYSRDELQALAQVAVERGVYVLSDEIYEKLIYGEARHHSIAALGGGIKDLTIVVNGVSKAYAMTGWRIGYAGAMAEVIAGMNKVQSQEISHPSSISQKAAVTALTGPQETVAQMRRAFDERRRYMVARLNALPGVSCPLPEGAFYAYPDVSAYYGRRAGSGRVEHSVGLCAYLLEEGKVACVPGAGFGTRPHIRLSYATSMAKIEEAMDRVRAALARLH